MKKTSLTRSIPYWLLLVLSLAAAVVGGWLVWDNTTTMQTTLLDGTATNVEVYVGQAWITAGAAILGAGIIGLLLTLGVAAAKSLVPASAPVLAEPIEWTGGPDRDDSLSDASAEAVEPATEADGSDAEPDAEDQNGSSGSTATATKISVK